jgi:hypothetical protein
MLSLLLAVIVYLVGKRVTDKIPFSSVAYHQKIKADDQVSLNESKLACA